MNKSIVIFTDLDETLLERKTYSFEKALPALGIIRERGIPLVICTSKTRTEVDIYRERLRNSDPFVTENGGGIFIPMGYFEDYAGHEAREIDGYMAIVLGTRYQQLRAALEDLRAEGFKLRGFGDMSQEEISSLTRLTEEEAALAKKRHFDEAFIFEGDEERLSRAVRRKGLRLTQGRLFHLTGENDKGRAVEILKGLFRRKFGDAVFIAVGDSPTDAPMLEAADYPVVVQRDDFTYMEGIGAKNLIKAEGVGPTGFNSAVIGLIYELDG